MKLFFTSVAILLLKLSLSIKYITGMLYGYISSNRDRTLRLGLFCMILALILWGKNNLADGARDDTANAIIDLMFDATVSANRLMHSSSSWMNFFQLSSSWCIDLNFLGMFLPWIHNGDSFRLIVAYGLFYGIRSIIQTVCILPYPNGIIWSFPMAPSITVPFGVTSDFMPSGHVGFCVIAAAEFHKRNWQRLKWAALMVGIYEGFVMLSSRNHYSIDLFFGAIMAHYFHGWAHSFCVLGPVDKIVGPYFLHNYATSPYYPVDDVPRKGSFGLEDIALGYPVVADVV